MRAKPILFWPKACSDIDACLDRAADDFTVVDTNCAYELRKLDKITSHTPIFDPFPGYGERYRDFRNHVSASGCHLHITGLDSCQRVLEALKDPSLAHVSIEELYNAIATPADAPTFRYRLTALFDWLHRNGPNTILSVALVFLAALISNALIANASVTAAVAAAGIFAVLYLCARLVVHAVSARRR